MHKVSNDQIQTALKHIFQRNNREYTYTTRGSMNREFVIPQIHNSNGEKMLSYRGPKLWQEIKTDMKEKNHKKFSKLYKSELLGKYV